MRINKLIRKPKRKETQMGTKWEKGEEERRKRTGGKKGRVAVKRNIAKVARFTSWYIRVEETMLKESGRKTV